MKINGKERGFALTIEAADELGKLCPGGDFRNLGDLFAGSTFQEIMKLDIQIAIILNKGYEDARAFFEPGYVPDYLTEADFRFFQVAEIGQLEPILTSIVKADQKVEIEVEPFPEKGKKTE